MLSPEQKRQALAHRAAGWTISSIAEKVGSSVSTLKRLFDEHSLKRGSITEEMIDAARNELVSNSDLKHQIAAMVADDLALIRKARLAISLTLDRITNDTDTPPVVQARSLAALCTAIGLNQAAYRKALQVSKIEASIDQDNIMALPIHYMSAEEQDAIVNAVNSDEFGLIESDDEEEDDIIDEGV